MTFLETCIVFNLQIRDNLRKQYPRTEFLCDKAGIAADESKAGLFCEGAFEQWAGVNVAKGLGGLVFGVAEVFLDEFFDGAEAGLDGFVVIAAEGITSDAAVTAGEARLVVIIVCGETDD